MAKTTYCAQAVHAIKWLLAQALSPLHTMRPESNLRISFTGTGGEFFILLIKNFFLTLITLGVYNFWARVNLKRYFVYHTVVAGGYFGWHATGKERFIGFLKASLVVGVMIGLNALLVKISPFLAIIMPIAVILLLPAIIVATYRYRMSRTSFNQVRFRFDGRAGDLAAVTIKGALLTLITFGIYAPWFAVAIRQYLYAHTYIGNSEFGYDGNGGDIFVIYAKGFILTMLTFGIYNSWLTAEISNYHTNHTTFQGQRLKGDVDGADIFVLNFTGPLVTLFTLGLWLPWWIVKLQAVMLKGISLTSFPDIARMEGLPDAGANAIAEGLADAASLLDNIADFLT